MIGHLKIKPFENFPLYGTYLHTYSCNTVTYINHMVNKFYPIENNAITNKLKTRLKSPEQEKII